MVEVVRPIQLSDVERRNSGGGLDNRPGLDLRLQEGHERLGPENTRGGKELNAG